MSPRNWLLGCALVGLLAACASLGIPTPTSNAQRAELARATLNGVYDSVVALRAGCKDTPPGPSCKLSDASKATVMAYAGTANEIITLVESGKGDTAACLAIAQKAQPAITSAASCLSLATQILTGIKATLGSRS